MRNLTFIILLTLLAFGACKKNMAGGSSTIRGKVVHHTTAIPGATVYIKYNATEFPGSDPGIYDTHVTADAGGNFLFKCYKGSYFLYGRAMQDTVNLRGGVPVTIRQNEVVDIELAVTEVH